MKYVHKNAGTCSMQVSFEIEDGIIKNIVFHGGCNGNAQGISKLAEGRNAKEVAEAIRNIRCGYKKTSCPDQLSKAIEKALESPPENAPESGKS